MWWRNLLYINNFGINENGICVGQTWYMSTEFQMFLCTPFVLLPMHWATTRKGWKWGMAIITALLTAMTAVIGGLAIARDWPFTMDLADPDDPDAFFDYLDDNYYMPWTRCQPYIVGIALGFVFHVTKGKRVKMNWVSTD